MADACPECGSRDVEGLNRAPMIAGGYSRFKCRSCGHFWDTAGSFGGVA